MIYMIMEKTGMSWYELMWRRSWVNVLMMFADAPKTIRKKPGTVTISGKEMAARHKAKKAHE
ncbi:hypothetical protein [Pedobacter sp. KBW01]|uniref:hypothetical protein n=1 Tax=Pedobacter sp. KBW01 TaxID=2153364 RepID=UPI000F594904|nr:hypothetical protein [Pedobacter sp. KBW01]